MSAKTLFKTTIVIWSEYDTGAMDLSRLGEEADTGSAYCASSFCIEIADSASDPDWDGTEFFDRGDNEETELPDEEQG